jgi:serine/threonine protein kinase/tetratricopeptide (TPR) repeat protein
MPDTIGHYRITEKLGEGGMGIVYAAQDERLGRSVAIKKIRDVSSDPVARERFWREARAAASVSHPNICQVYEISEEDGELFIAMELLEGESLASRLGRGALPLDEGAQLGLAILAALDALHRRDFVHRDLKPSNVFLTPHGPKLLDFGLARQTSKHIGGSDASLTLPGLMLGSPGYMAPEQVFGEAVDARTDLFAVGAILFEVLTGKQAFSGRSIVEVIEAVANQQPPVLGGSASVAAVDRVIHKAVSKKPEDRYTSAPTMAEDLRAALILENAGQVSHARTVIRLIVLPFKMLRQDADIEFLAVSLSDAIASTLSGLGSLVVRSSIVASRFATGAPDLKALAVEADVDVVLLGTLLRAGNQLRVNTQLVEVPHGAILWSHTSQAPVDDVFELQDDLSRRIVESLELPLTVRDHRMLRHDVPANARAYELYLRANQIGHLAMLVDTEQWELARDLYRQCLDEDPRYAPAWARLGRIYRVMGKWGREDSGENLEQAEKAFKQALAINPDLSIAHNLYAYLEVDSGHAVDAMLRLVERAEARSTDPELYAGLVHACRYCGLLDASAAAHRRARRLDSKIPTSVGQTYFMLGEYAQVLMQEVEATPMARNAALGMLGREAEAIANLRAAEQRIHTRYRDLLAAARALYEGHRDESLDAVQRIVSAKHFKDPEALFYAARILARLAEVEPSLALLERALTEGFFCFPAFARDAWLDPLRAESRFKAILREAEERHREALNRFRAAGGDRAIGVGV